MKNTYANTKKELDTIRSKYSCAGELLFRTAIQCVMEHGTDSLTDDWSYGHLKGDINERHNIAEVEGTNLWVTREFELAILECAREIARVDAYSMLVYIQKEVWLSREGGIDYKRTVQLLKNCLGWFADDCCDNAEMLERFELLDFDDDEIEDLGYGYLFNNEEEEN
jgi:hypothetical protein